MNPEPLDTKIKNYFLEHPHRISVAAGLILIEFGMLWFFPFWLTLFLTGFGLIFGPLVAKFWDQIKAFIISTWDSLS